MQKALILLTQKKCRRAYCYALRLASHYNLVAPSFQRDKKKLMKAYEKVFVYYKRGRKLYRTLKTFRAIACENNTISPST